MSKKNIENKYIPDDLGVYLHTALRKCCDSKPTTVVWNLIQLRVYGVENGWEDYLQYLSEGLTGREFSSREDLANTIKQLSLGFVYFGEPFKAALHTLFEMFSEDDWLGYTDLVYGI